MRSTFNDDDDDEFAPNPFRDNGSGGGTDFFEAPVPQQQQQQPSHPHGMLQQQQPYALQQPDPNSGMIGSLPPPHAPTTTAGSIHDPTQYLSGPMDQKAAANYGPSTLNNNNNNSSALSQPPSLFSWRGILACCRLDNATKLFDVDTVDVYLRIKAAATQFHQPDYFRLSVVGDPMIQQAANSGALSPSEAATVPVEDRKGPDLYGPFWISMTLMFILGMTANLSNYVHHQNRKANVEFEYDLTHLMNAMYIVFLYAFGLPTAFWLTCQCLGMPAIPWALWVCCYGYSLTPVMAGALVAWWLPYTLYHWLVLAAAVAASGLLVVRNLSTPLLSQDVDSSHAKAAPLLLSILGAHFTFLLVLKLTFYP